MCGGKNAYTVETSHFTAALLEIGKRGIVIMPKLDRSFAARIVFYLLGQLVVAFGVIIALNANLGISPVSSTPRAINLALEAHGVTFITLGNCVIFFNIVCVLLQFILLRKFKVVNLFQLLISFAFGYFVDFARFLIGGFVIPTYAGKLVMLALSILLIAIGLSLYLGVKLIPMASEGLGLAITEKIGKHPYHTIKIVVDCCFVGLALVIMLVFTGGITYTAPGSTTAAWVVREGTVVTALVVGKVMGWLKPVIDPILNRFCFPGGQPAQS